MSLISLSQNPAMLGDRLHDALAVTPSLIADIIHQACRRFPSQRQVGKTERLQQLIKMGAWTDAALALIELELPQWRVRRLAYDDSEWYCSLSRDASCRMARPARRRPPRGPGARDPQRLRRGTMSERRYATHQRAVRAAGCERLIRTAAD